MGPWIRLSTGDSTVDGTGKDSLLGVTAQSKISTSFSGIQSGVDSGVLNIAGTGTNAHLGVTGGYVSAQSTETIGPGSTTKFSVPFAGVYGVIRHDAASADLTYRHDFETMMITDPVALSGPTKLSGSGDNVYGNTSYTFVLGQYTVTPGLGLGYSHIDVGKLPTLAGGNLNFSGIDSVLGKAGVEVGRSFAVTDTLYLRPFVTGPVWHEFAGNSIVTFSDVSGLSDRISSTRVGTYGQIGVGLTANILPVGFTGFVRGDFRFGDKLNGMAGTLGMRYSF